MPEDRSLDDFASAGTAESETGAEADPAESTSTWTAEGADCDRCGATVSRRWHDGDDLVCTECTEW